MEAEDGAIFLRTSEHCGGTTGSGSTIALHLCIPILSQHLVALWTPFIPMGTPPNHPSVPLGTESSTRIYGDIYFKHDQKGRGSTGAILRIGGTGMLMPILN